MKKECPRCAALFECKNDEILNCECVTIVLTRADYEYIQENYDDCLCVACLKEIQLLSNVKNQANNEVD